MRVDYFLQRFVISIIGGDYTGFITQNQEDCHLFIVMLKPQCGFVCSHSFLQELSLGYIRISNIFLSIVYTQRCKSGPFEGLKQAADFRAVVFHGVNPFDPLSIADPGRSVKTPNDQKCLWVQGLTILEKCFIL